MRNVLVSVIVALGLLAGCHSTTYGPVMAYAYKPQKLEIKEKLATDLLSCGIQSTNKVPANIQITSTAGYSTPVTCSGYYCSGGYSVGGKTSSYDANSALRLQVFNQCLASEGYLFNTKPIPACRLEQIPASYVNAQTPLHSPKPGSCFIVSSVAYGGNVILLASEQLLPNKD